MWENIDKTRQDSAHYSVMRQSPGVKGMDALREMFPEARCNEMNFVLFSTSGIHGTYNTIEDAEAFLATGEGFGEVTFLIVHPRIVALRYGVCDPESMEDIFYLKRLRSSSIDAVSKIFRDARQRAASTIIDRCLNSFLV